MLCLSTCLVSCSAMQSTPWDWLDDPEKQHWFDVTLSGEGWEVSYSVPDRLKNGGQHTQSDPPLEKGGSHRVFLLPPESPKKDWARLAAYNWDSWWGGFFKESGVDFWLEVAVNYHANENAFLEMSPEEFIQWRIAGHREFFARHSMTPSESEEFFFENYRIDKHVTAQSLTWIYENSPTVQGDYIIFIAPLSNSHILEFGFFVNKKRYNWQDDPEWNQHRWDIVYKILDSVSITAKP